ncbi:MAG TPA: hypothetical protein VFU71_01920 [Burkholderiaceae bacterium]|nr:hypothetical protein [Burkholderiaceae bacterium]
MINICIVKLLAMPAHVRPAVPLADALQGSEPLARLAERLKDSKRRFECIEAELPPPLAAQAQPGPLDAHGWTLLAHTPAAAAKLRQLVPLFEDRLAKAGYVPLLIRIKVQPRSSR